ncbi:hypothetical protein DEIPH_ctg139orf0084 [Deinococcus phoenicis]|uniref:Uncharacterized protein n=1 Tax=Deinococcus phoenicis TaxID=1476583 RepID=A0A016QK50_9DEIO|nr:hypothetical protein [Deinococcus phoenicis]EYB66361.1 hypothetical protein DEIPH_ctg139orf0084 [Deinococcus phoenicis]
MSFSAFLAAVTWALDTTDTWSPHRLIGWEDEPEVAWPTLFERVPWGPGTASALERLTWRDEPALP